MFMMGLTDEVKAQFCLRYYPCVCRRRVGEGQLGFGAMTLTQVKQIAALVA